MESQLRQEVDACFPRKAWTNWKSEFDKAELNFLFLRLGWTPGWTNRQGCLRCSLTFASEWYKYDEGAKLFSWIDKNPTKTLVILPFIPINKILRTPNFSIFPLENTKVKSWMIPNAKLDYAGKSFEEKS